MEVSTVDVDARTAKEPPHYLARANERLMAEFDADFYLRLYPDLEQTPLSARDHFATHGVAERRYPSARWFWEDVEAVESSGVLALDNDERNAATRLIQMAQGVSPTLTFDATFIASYYYRTIAIGENLFAFYCRHAHHPWCFDHYQAGAAHFERLRSEPMFDGNFVRRTISTEFRGLDPAAYYCTEGFRIPLDPSARFSSRGYLAEYPDVRAAQIIPLIHYVDHGRAEGRGIPPPSETTVFKGGRAFQKDKPTILVCSHEASRSGAPLVGLNLARQLADRANVISILLRGGPLEDDFKALSQAVVITGDTPGRVVSALDHVIERFRPKAAILNSVETAKLLAALVVHDVPAISLVHEFAQYVYPFDVISKAITLSHQVVFPSKLVRDAALRELAQLGFSPSSPNNLVIRPQGRPVLPPAPISKATLPAILRTSEIKRRPLVVGAGWVQPRKGVDLFIEAARILKHELGIDADFAWVGGNYSPRRDLVTAAYLADQIEASGLVEDVHFVEEQSNLAPIWAAADVFFLSSRLDPYPNVALDAIAEGLPVVCFKRATGIADLGERFPDHVSAAPYNDARKAAEFIAGHIAKGRRQGGKAPLPRELERALSFSDYADDIFYYLKAAMTQKESRTELATALANDGEMDAMLFLSDLPSWLATSEDTIMAASNLAKVATVSALNGLPVGRIRPQRHASLSRELKPGETGAEDAWRADDAHLLSEVSVPDRASASSIPFSAVLFTDDMSTVGRFYELALRRPKIGSMVIVSNLIHPADLAASGNAAMNGVVVLKRAPESLDALLKKLGDDPFLLMDDVPALDSGTDWISSLWTATLQASQREPVFLRRLHRAESGPWLKAVADDVGGDSSVTRRMLESSIVGTQGKGALNDTLENLMTSGSSTDLWHALAVCRTLATTDWKVLTVGRASSVRTYNLTNGREPILPSSSERVDFSMASLGAISAHWSN
jgi:glycosyltransferase involved in cell wall biosynthesis